jgi:hypothetical protein
MSDDTMGISAALIRARSDEPPGGPGTVPSSAPPPTRQQPWQRQRQQGQQGSHAAPASGSSRDDALRPAPLHLFFSPSEDLAGVHAVKEEFNHVRQRKVPFIHWRFGFRHTQWEDADH